MPIIRATAILNHVSGVPKDASRNVWHFNATFADNAALTAIGNGVSAFYVGCQTLFGPQISAAADAHRVEMALVDPNAPGEGDDQVSSLLATRAFSLTPAGEAFKGMPNEVAVVLSFDAGSDAVPEEQGLIRPASRRRGRIFLGPVSYGAADASAPGYEPVIKETFREMILDAYDLGHVAWEGGGIGVQHTVYSRRDAVNRVVDRISVNNEFDTVRRRGRKASFNRSRVIVPASPSGPRNSVDVALAV